ncbi:hypothetical protein AXF42_Ash009563 [Apostasia shenzhenica]|uniref:Transcription repressor n=1 Tax=Apostasia shenzhenica TaxID=1088818 RepID=A0A2I0B9B2_9ASPA|nr:hypothetical protein AXF42_Ash009563 [Apostasia shenzhenica]
MKWGRKCRDDDRRKMKETAKKPSRDPSSLPSSMFSGIFSFSWISRLKHSGSSRLKPDSPAANPNVAFFSGSDRLSYSPKAHDSIVADEAPRRRSVGDDNDRHEKGFRGRIREVSRSARHNSLGELELRPIELDPTALPSSILRRRQPERRRQRNFSARSAPSRSPLKQIDTNVARDGRSRIGSGGKLRQGIRPRVKVCSPRGAAAARRRLEDGEEWKSLESLAVVKRSNDPEGDFGESMAEMIREKGIRRPDEMERLLACYIALNADEHHDVIVKAFRRVWFDVIDCRRLAGGAFCV